MIFKRSSFNFYLPILILLSLGLRTANAGDPDLEAIEKEKTKELTFVNIQAIETEFREVQREIDQYDFSDPESPYQNAEGFSDECLFLPEDPETPEQLQARLENEKRQHKLVMTSERSILASIKAFETTRPEHTAPLQKIRAAWEANLKTKNNSWPSGLAYRIAGYFEKNKDYQTAIQFYQLAASSYLNDGSDEDLASGRALINYYNESVQGKRYHTPTPALFSAVNSALRYLRSGANSCDIAYPFACEMLARRDMMVRWPLSPEALIKDPYFPKGALLEKVYSTGFVDQLLSDVERFVSIFKAYKYVQANKDHDLLKALLDAGFVGIRNACRGNPHYIWINPQGYSVRVKPSAHHGGWEFTVGLTFLNPVKWAEGNVATHKIKRRDVPKLTGVGYFDDLSCYDDLASAEINEVFKLVVDDGLVMVAPAFRSYYWSNRRLVDPIMAKAHRTLKFVGKSKKGSTDLSEIDSACRF